MIRVAINGFGRIGRNVARSIISDDRFELVAVNDAAPLETMMHLFKYDSVHGKLKASISPYANGFEVDRHRVRYTQHKHPSDCDWKSVQADVVIESTGLFKTHESGMAHIAAGAKKVILSAPADDQETKTIVLGVNDQLLLPNDLVVSNASCTTNSAAPMIQLIDQLFGIESGYITTVHSYTGDQRLHDTPNKDLRRARAAAVSIIPTTTGAAKAMSRIFPELDGKLGGCGIRVPVPDGSLTDLTCMVRKTTSVEEVNEAFRQAAMHQYKGIIEYCNEPIVSIDIVGNPHSCIFDAELTSVIGNMVKVVGWYDNEWGYSNRLKELMLKMIQH
ncbi:MAG TPA: type I glyceraldehyde-3-phosphate dehydrogenase [Luteibaculaceae bacterium]|nr:type I glyceraldehyde-3-phosphate dehydrogenase [Luteibaculaceae bacterium]